MEDDLRNIIEQMRAQGISDEDIRVTLRDMGVDDALINKLLGSKEGDRQAPVPALPKTAPPTSQAPLVPGEETPRTPQSTSPPVEHEELPEISALAAVGASSKMEELAKKVDSLHEKLDISPFRDDLLEIKEDLKEIKQEIEELKGMLNGFKKILQEILDTGRSVLVEMKNR